ncbi:MAG: hypothetical protein ACFFCS_17945 [Candidatus Hodarchaeota archaeon]
MTETRENSLMASFRALLSEKRWWIILLITGPLFHLSISIYLYGVDIIHIATYAEMSLALPVSLLTLLCVGFGILVVQVKKHSARLGLGVLAIVYIVMALATPAFDAEFNLIRALGLSPWMVAPEVSPIFAILAWTSIGAYILTLISIVRLDGIHLLVPLMFAVPVAAFISLVEDNILLGTIGLVGLTLAFVSILPRVLIKKNAPIMGQDINPFTKTFRRALRSRKKFRYTGTVTFLGAIIVGSILLTGNLLWYTQTYTLHYDANSVSIEYWIGADENEYNGTFQISSHVGVNVSATDNVTIDLSPLSALPERLYATRFFINYTTNDKFWNYGTWWYLSNDQTILNLVNISSTLANRINLVRNATDYINLTCVGYYTSRIQALSDTKAVMVTTGGIGGGVPYYKSANQTNDRPEFNATVHLYDNWSIGIQAQLGCGPGYLLNLWNWTNTSLHNTPPQGPYIEQMQDTRLYGPPAYRRVIEGVMMNIEKIHGEWRMEMIENYTKDTLGWEIETEELSFYEWYWSQNTLSEAEYFGNLSQWNNFIDGLYNTVQLPNGTPDETARFRFINCGIPENLIDYWDGDPDYAMYYHNLGYGTHFATDGYMFYRGRNQPYWVYGYLKFLANKPKVVPHEEKLILLGSVGTGAYRNDFTLEEFSQFKAAGSDEWIRDINDDGNENGFEALLLDMMMTGAMGIPRINIWPGPGPRSDCCDYREWSRNLVDYNESRDFFVEMRDALAQDWDIQFAKLPDDEHYWDKILVDIVMDFRRPKGLWVFAIFGILVILFSLFHGRILNIIKPGNKNSRKER